MEKESHELLTKTAAEFTDKGAESENVGNLVGRLLTAVVNYQVSGNSVSGRTYLSTRDSQIKNPKSVTTTGHSTPASVAEPIKYGAGRPDKALYDKEEIKAEIGALQVKAVRVVSRLEVSFYFVFLVRISLPPYVRLSGRRVWPFTQPIANVGSEYSAYLTGSVCLGIWSTGRAICHRLFNPPIIPTSPSLYSLPSIVLSRLMTLRLLNPTHTLYSGTCTWRRGMRSWNGRCTLGRLVWSSLTSLRTR